MDELIHNLTQPVDAPLSALLAGEKTPASTMGVTNPFVQRRLGFGSPEEKAEIGALAAQIAAAETPLARKHADEMAQKLHVAGFATYDDVKTVLTEDRARLCGLSIAQAALIADLISEEKGPATRGGPGEQSPGPGPATTPEQNVNTIARTMADTLQGDALERRVSTIMAYRVSVKETERLRPKDRGSRRPHFSAVRAFEKRLTRGEIL